MHFNIRCFFYGKFLSSPSSTDHFKSVQQNIEEHIKTVLKAISKCVIFLMNPPLMHPHCIKSCRAY